MNFFKIQIGALLPQIVCRVLNENILYTVSSAPCVLSNSSYLFPATSTAELLKNFRGRNPVQYIHCTIQRSNFGSYPLRILHFKYFVSSFLFVIWVWGEALVITDTAAWLGGWCVGVYMCVCICVCVCVLVWRGWIGMIDSHGPFWSLGI